MKKEKTIILFTFLIFLTIGLNTRFKIVPPLGKILSPFTGYLQNGCENKTEGEIDIKGLSSPVKVLFDKRSVPHLFAKNDNDLFFAQGYIHARDRLWQMDFLARAAAGKLSEVVGNKTITMDKAIRRKGLLMSAEQSLEYIAKAFPQTINHLNAYSNGVNAYIESLKEKEFPVEYKLLDYSPEKWSPLKTILIQKYMANMLAGFDNDAEKTNALKFFGQQEYNLLYESSIQDQSAMIDTFKKDQSMIVPKQVATAYPTIEKKNNYHNDPFQPPPGYGSNSWAISGQKSATNYPILANDPHLALTLPSIWYEIQLSNSKMNAYGVSIPGVPYIIIGFNNDIAWGITNGETDVKDWYSLKFRNNNDEYYLGGKWRKTVKKVEHFSVKGYTDVIDTVLYTEVGPVVYNDQFQPEPGKANMAMSWLGNEKSNDFNTFYLLNKGTGYADYTNAIQNFRCPNLNFSFASKRDIAITHQGAIPIRINHEGEFVIEGATAKNIYQKMIPQEYLPSEKNPKKEFIFSANQNPIGVNYPYHLYGYYGVYRNRTLENRLNGYKKTDAEEMKQLQLNDYNLFAAEALPVMLKKINQKTLSPIEQNFVDSLIAWDYTDKKNKCAPLYFQAWWERFNLETWDEISDTLNPILPPKNYITLKLLANLPNSKYFDKQSSPEIEKAEDLLLDALKVQANGIHDYEIANGKLTWGKSKNTIFSHLASIGAFSREGIQTNGSRYSINAITENWGPGWRMVVQFGKNHPKAWGINPGGQSGNPGSSFYGNGIDDWSNGLYYDLVFIIDPDDKTMDTKTFIIK